MTATAGSSPTPTPTMTDTPQPGQTTTPTATVTPSPTAGGLTAGTLGNVNTPSSGFPGNNGRALLTKFTMVSTATTSMMHMAFFTDSLAGSSAKGIVYRDNNGAVGTLVGATDGVSVPAGGGWVQVPVTMNLTPGNYWIGMVNNNYQANPGQTYDTEYQIIRAEGVTYASPTNTITVADTYVGRLSVYLDYVGTGPVTPTPTPTATITPTNSVTPTVSLSPSATVGTSPTPTPTITLTPSITRSPVTPTPSPTTGGANSVLGVNVGTSDTFPSSSNRALLTSFVMSQSGAAAIFGAQFSATATSGSSFKGLIYSDNGANAPSGLVAVSDAVAIPPGGGFVETPIAANLSPGTYWLGIVTTSHQADTSQTLGGAARSVRVEGLSYASPPSTFPTVIDAVYDNLFNVYVKYAAVVVTATPTPTRTNTPVTPTPTRTPVTPTPTPTISQSAPAPAHLALDLSYVNTGSAKYTSFINFVNAARDGVDPYGFSAKDAAYAYLITGDASYAALAVLTADAQVTAAENAIAAGGFPAVAGDSYLEVGPFLADVAMAYAWCNPTQTQKDRWKAYADQALFNVWNNSIATWGGRSYPWTGWSTSDPGNNYYYSFMEATSTWSLVSNNVTYLNLLRNNKFPALKTYMDGLTPGGGSREGTGYGAAFKNLFEVYQIWRDSGQQDIANLNSHMTDTVKFWIHATMPTRNKYQPIGDLARDSYPNMFDYHRDLVLKARRLTYDTQVQDDSSWWLNNISVGTMSQGFERKYDLLPAGTNTTTPPAALSYYSQGTGNLFSRTSWATNATYAHFIAGIYDQSHAHQEQGAFTLFNGDFLAVSGNIFSQSGIEQGVECHNVLHFKTSGGATIGQNNGTATMTHNIGSGGNFTANAVLKGIMGSSQVTSWNRAIDFTNGVLLVNDTYATTGGATATFQVCTPTMPTRVGNVVTAGNLRLEVLTPGSPTITLVNMTTLGGYNSGWRIDISGGAGTYSVRLERA